MPPFSSLSKLPCLPLPLRRSTVSAYYEATFPLLSKDLRHLEVRWRKAQLSLAQVSRVEKGTCAALDIIVGRDLAGLVRLRRVAVAVGTERGGVGDHAAEVMVAALVEEA